jgi:hypothetical protein
MHKFTKKFEGATKHTSSFQVQTGHIVEAFCNTAEKNHIHHFGGLDFSS